MIYFFVLFILLINTYIFDFLKIEKRKNTAFYLSFFCLFLISAFKYRVGSDIIMYADEYEKEVLPLDKTSLDYLFLSFNRQFGWQLLASICKSITTSFILVQFIVAFFVNYSIFNFIRKYSYLPFFGILLYYILCYTQFNFEVLRQSVAVSFFLLGVDYYLERKWIKYFICVFGGFSFHISALILVLVPLLRGFQNNKFFSSPLFHVILMGLIFLLLPFLINFIPMFINNTDALAVQAYYANKDTYEVHSISYLGNVVMFSFYYAISLFLGKEAHKWYLPFILLYLVLQIVNMSFPIIYRLAQYFIMFFIIGVTNTVAFCKIDRRMLICLLVIAFPYITYRKYTTDWDGIPVYRMYYPYYTYLNPKNDYERENRVYVFY